MARPRSPRVEGRNRVIAAALDLFAEQGFSATSLQQIADHLGVTKAAVYYHFRNKDDIVVAVVNDAFHEMSTIVAATRTITDPNEAMSQAITGYVDLIVHHRKAMCALGRDPQVARIVGLHQQYQELIQELDHTLVGADSSTARRVLVTVIANGMLQASSDPALAGISDEELQQHLFDIAHGILAPAHT